MKNIVLTAVVTSLLTLAACGEASSDLKASETAGAQVAADLSKMDIPEIIDFMTDESEQMTTLLSSVTDGPSAEAAVSDIRVIIPRLNASIRSLENLDVENVTLSIGNMRKMIKVAESQSELINEVVRISKIPEAREILEKEFDKIEITK